MSLMNKASSSQHPRRRKRLKRAAIAVASVLVLAIVGLVVWANVGVMQAEPLPMDSVLGNPLILVTDTADSLIMKPTSGHSDVGLVFIPGAKVDARAYLNKLSGVVEETGLTVIITKPILNLAFFDLRPLSTFTDHATSVKTWYVGGHSLGGVRACQFAAQPDVAGLILFGSYCANDLSDSDIGVLSITASNDGLSTPEKVADAANLVPSGTVSIQIEGANHAAFGDYGAQAGDGPSTLSSDEVRLQLTNRMSAFLGLDSE